MWNYCGGYKDKNNNKISLPLFSLKDLEAFCFFSYSTLVLTYFVLLIFLNQVNNWNYISHSLTTQENQKEKKMKQNLTSESSCKGKGNKKYSHRL